MERDIRKLEPRQTTDAFVLDSSAVLEELATGKPLHAVSARLVTLVEEHIQACMVTLLQADEGLETLSLVAASHDMPEDYLALLERAPIGPFGTCARAAHSGRIVIHPVNADTEDWAMARQLIELYQFRASWSFPLFAPCGDIVGTLGLYFDHFREPGKAEHELLERAAQLGGIAVEQYRSKLAAQRADRRFRELVESIPEGVVALNQKRRTVFVSKRAGELGLIEPADGSTLQELYGLSEEHVKALLDGEALRLDVGPRWLHLRATTTSDGAVVVVHDGTEERAMQEHLIQADRMASMGTLAAGVAHEINTPLMSITVGVELLRSEAEPGSQTEQVLEDAQIAAKRISTITQDLLTIARAPDDLEAIADVGEVVKRSLRLGRHSLKHEVKVEVGGMEDLPAVAMSPTHLGQVVLNLLINAAQAFPDPEPDTSLIRVTAEHHDNQVKLTIADNGPGMPRHIAGRIFDPFFTTKSQSEGTGLGLPIARGLLQRANGSIEVDAAPGAGCKFVVRVPAAYSDDRSPAVGEQTSAQSLKVLFVDDDHALLRMADRMLAPRGHAVVTAKDGPSALQHLADDDEFDLVLVDLMMPQMDGATLARKIEQRHPRLASRMVFVTGGALSESARLALSRSGDRFLAKPFSAAQVEALAESIGSKAIDAHRHTQR